ncbi:type I polyketide synthase [Nocardiopsis dassonvillei]|uniref:type I polyketide synthase n=1 Tax=Nocardiopsis dassonvillei TaxID=2014 RepID=UPI00362A55D9
MTTTNRKPVAIVGMGCRLPGGITTPAGLWEALLEGRDCVTRIPDERWKQMVKHLHPDQVPGQPFPAGVVDADAFDRKFFGIGPDEAAEMDPQQKLLLETVYEALTDASLRPTSLAESATGVYVGAASTDQASVNFGAGHRAGVHTGSGAGMAILANRVSFLLDLSGPSLTFDTACSSSLTALHYAVRDLRAGAVETAIVAGTNILTSPIITASFVEAGVLAPDGRCRPFDSQAAGYVRSEGTVALVLTRTDRAREQGHRVWSHVAGTAIGHGGASRHLLRPRAERQTAVIRQALADAAVHPDRVGWVQAHGTATRAGDRIEAEGIAQALDRDTPVPVGSAKAALGHLEGGAGALGVMVAALAVHHGQIPPTLHHHTLRHRLEGLVRVPTTVENWPTGEQLGQEETCVAGVSSFGFGGANAHAIITNAPPLEPPPEQDPMPLPETVLLSAHSPAALASAAARLAEHAPQGRSVGTIADTALVHGSHARYRTGVVAADLGTLVQGLRSIQDGSPNADVVDPGRAADLRPQTVFVYTGHGGHHPDAGAELLRVPTFAHALHEAREKLAERTGYPVWEPGQSITSFIDAQHCTFLIQVALTALLADRGIVPDLVLGHSVGEIAAAHTAGVLPLVSAARVLAHRSRLLGGLAEAGGLLAVRAGVEETTEFLAAYDGQLSIASYSAPRVQVVAGPHGDLLHLHTVLDTEGVWSRPVADVIPAHSSAVDSLVPALEQALSGLRPQTPRVPIISTAYPHEDTAEAGLWGPVYWAAQARQPVRFTDALHQAVDVPGGGPVVFVEIGPKGLLVEHVTHTLGDTARRPVAATADPTTFARAVGELYTRGITPTGPTHRAHPNLVIAPGWNHTRAPGPVAAKSPARTPVPGEVEAHLAAEVGRLVHLPCGLDPTSSWADLPLESHTLLALTSRLRRVPAWRGVDIQVFLPARTWRQVAATLSALLAVAS